MSQGNVEIMRQAFEQWLRGGATADAVPPEFYAPDIEWDQSAYPFVDMPDRGTGRDELLGHLATYLSGWTGYHAEVMEFIDAGENVVVVLHEEASIGDSGVSIERDLFLVWTIRDGLVVKYRSFETREEALEAAGLREWSGPGWAVLTASPDCSGHRRAAGWRANRRHRRRLESNDRRRWQVPRNGRRRGRIA
jgi:ketosteroid isomerase-like protein